MRKLNFSSAPAEKVWLLELKDRFVKFYKEIDPDFVRQDRDWTSVEPLFAECNSVETLLPVVRAVMDSVKSDALQKIWPAKRALAKKILKRAARHPTFDSISSAANMFFMGVRDTINPYVKIPCINKYSPQASF